MRIGLVVSLNFRVAHVAHLVASYKQLQDLGYNAILLIAPEFISFLPKGIKYITDLSAVKDVSFAIFWFPAKANVSIMSKLKSRYNSKIVYVLHEPMETFKTYRKTGMSIIEICKVYLKYYITLSFIYLSDYIILPSQKAVDLYSHSLAKRINPKYMLIPLLFDDESNGQVLSRKFFSYIGTIARDHAYDEYVSFISKAVDDNTIPDSIHFLIATRNEVIKDQRICKLLNTGRLKVVEGRPLTDEEINSYYSQSIAIWNAYHRTTQSGVLAKASMFGTPAIVCRKNLSEFSIENENVVCCNDNHNYDEIKAALLRLIDNFETFSNKSRSMFMSNFYYKNHNNKMENLLRKLIPVKMGGVVPIDNIFATVLYERRVA